MGEKTKDIYIFRLITCCHLLKQTCTLKVKVRAISQCFKTHFQTFRSCWRSRRRRSSWTCTCRSRRWCRCRRSSRSCRSSLWRRRWSRRLWRGCGRQHAHRNGRGARGRSDRARRRVWAPRGWRGRSPEPAFRGLPAHRAGWAHLREAQGEDASKTKTR